MGETFESGKRIIDDAFEEACQKMMMSKGETLEKVIEEYPTILTEKKYIEEYVTDCIKNNYIGRVSFYNEINDTCKFRDHRTIRLKEFQCLKEIIIYKGKIYENYGNQDSRGFTSNKFIEVRMNKEPVNGIYFI